jgi:hypothetical protein
MNEFFVRHFLQIVGGLLLILPLVGWGEEVRSGLPEMLSDAPPCKRTVCEKIILVDCGAVIDGPLYVYNASSKRLLSVCGGACMPMRRAHDLICNSTCNTLSSYVGQCPEDAGGKKAPR